DFPALLKDGFVVPGTFSQSRKKSDQTKALPEDSGDCTRLLEQRGRERTEGEERWQQQEGGNQCHLRT
ncbi:hypothetical protein PIB30_068970, partial [Stylosanthes scabra]|nr:hypothetical protein [Stylosanthes scabra]